MRLLAQCTELVKQCLQLYEKQVKVALQILLQVDFYAKKYLGHKIYYNGYRTILFLLKPLQFFIFCFIIIGLVMKDKIVRICEYKRPHFFVWTVNFSLVILIRSMRLY